MIAMDPVERVVDVVCGGVVVAAAGGVHDSGGHGQDAQPESFGFIGGGVPGEGEAGGEGQ